MKRLTVFFVIFVGCRTSGQPPPSPESAPTPSGEMTIAYPDAPATLDPYTFEGDTNATRDLLRPVLPTLLKVTPSGSYAPGIALNVPELAADFNRVRFELNPKAVWSDGAPITSADVLHTYEKIQASPHKGRYVGVAGIDADGPHAIVITLKHRHVPWRQFFSEGHFVLPKHGVVWGGPFVLETFEEDLKVTYKANPNWWGRPPRLERVEVLFVPDEEISLRLLKKGGVDAIAMTSRSNLDKSATTIAGIEAVSVFGASFWELAFNHKAGASDPAGRALIADSIDRAGIAEALFKGTAKGLPNIEGLGGRMSRRLILSAPGENSTSALLVRSIQKALETSGFEIEIRSPESKDFYATWRRDGRFDIAVWETRMRGELRSNLHPPAGLNYSRVSSAELDNALNGGDRKATEKLLGEVLPAMPLLETKMFWISKSKLAPNATVDGPFWNLQSLSP